MANSLAWVKTGNKPSINTLPDDVLLEIFDSYRLSWLRAWNHNGWHNLAHTCRRWRHIILSSPCRLDLQLYSTYGTPVAEMLTHSPPLPLFLDYGAKLPLPAKDEEGVLLALQQHDRVYSIDIYASTTSLVRFLAVINGTFPVLVGLELSVWGPDEDESEDDDPEYLRLPQTFQAPHLRRLELKGVGDAIDNGWPLLSSLSGLVYLAIARIPVPIHLPVETLASSLSLMPQLEALCLEFDPRPWGDPINLPSARRILLPNLSAIVFRGDSSYLECLASQISAPLLTDFNAVFIKEPSSALSHLSRILSAAVALRFPVASVEFSGTGVESSKVAIRMESLEQILDRQPYSARFQIIFLCDLLSLQVTSAGEMCATLEPMFSGVKTLHLDLEGLRWQFGPEGDIEDSRWHDLLRPFRNVEKLQVDASLMGDLSSALSLNHDSGLFMEILPELRKLTRPHYARFGKAFDGFISAREDVGLHIVKRRRPPVSDFDGEEADEEDEGEDEGESDGEDEEDEGGKGEGQEKVHEEQEQEEGEGEEPDIELGVEDEIDEFEGGDPDVDKDDSDSWTNDDLTELDSDSDSDFDLVLYLSSLFVQHSELLGLHWFC